MPIDVALLKRWPFQPIVQTYSARDTILYALGVGLGHDPMDRAASLVDKCAGKGAQVHSEQHHERGSARGLRCRAACPTCAASAASSIKQGRKPLGSSNARNQRPPVIGTRCSAPTHRAKGAAPSTADRTLRWKCASAGSLRP